MPLLRPLIAVLVAPVLAGCVVPFPIPVLRDTAAPEVAVQVGDRTLTLRRAAETFPVAGPVNALTADGIAMSPDQPLPVRGQGEPAVVVGGTALGEWALAEQAIRSFCAIPDGGDAAAGFDPARRTYDADAAEALYPLATCPQLPAMPQ